MRTAPFAASLLLAAPLFAGCSRSTQTTAAAPTEVAWAEPTSTTAAAPSAATGGDNRLGFYSLTPVRL